MLILQIAIGIILGYGFIRAVQAWIDWLEK